MKAGHRLTEMKRIISKYYELYANELRQPRQMEKFLARHKVPKLAQKGTENLNRCVTAKKTESDLNNLLRWFHW